MAKWRRGLFIYVIFVSFFLKRLVPVSPVRVLSITMCRPSVSLGLHRPVPWVFLSECVLIADQSGGHVQEC